MNKTTFKCSKRRHLMTRISYFFRSNPSPVVSEGKLDKRISSSETYLHIRDRSILPLSIGQSYIYLRFFPVVPKTTPRCIKFYTSITFTLICHHSRHNLQYNSFYLSVKPRNQNSFSLCSSLT